MTTTSRKWSAFKRAAAAQTGGAPIANVYFGEPEPCGRCGLRRWWKGMPEDAWWNCAGCVKPGYPERCYWFLDEITVGLAAKVSFARPEASK
jgi:hypothetical protein